MQCTVEAMVIAVQYIKKVYHKSIQFKLLFLLYMIFREHTSNEYSSSYRRSCAVYFYGKGIQYTV